MGEPKQMLQYEGKSLLQRAVQSAVETGCEPIVVVVGSNQNSVSESVDTSAAILIYNPDWEQGMASSINTGVTELLRLNPGINATIIMLCDQPFADAQLLNALKNENLSTDTKIIACAYKDTLGVPVLFDRYYFQDLLELKGEEGAKKLIMKHQEDVLSIPFPNGAIDIDTAADYEHLQIMQNPPSGGRGL